MQMQNNNLKFLGIQMDCTSDSIKNANHIAKSLYDNPECDYAITPECALSGYGKNCTNESSDEALDEAFALCEPDEPDEPEPALSDWLKAATFS